jgi:PTH1 family peptidyl-tRNA hydrolase
MGNIFDIFKSIEKESGGAKTGAPEMLVVFLGNPGKEYERTRHNAGFMLSDVVAERLGIRIDRARFKALTGEAVYGGVKTLFIKPQTYMNLSGEAVREALDFYKLSPETQMIVVYDDVYIATGKLRIRQKGTDGGHNGIKSIIYHTSTDVFARIRVGVGTPPKGYPMPDWVLGVIPQTEREAFVSSLERAEKALEMMVSGKVLDAMNRYNG